jgi:hypothetical protein
MELVTVATFESESPACALKERLSGAGVPAQVFDERKVQRYWFLTKPHAAVRVRVESDNWDKATRLSEDWDTQDGVLHAALRCPECGSTRVEYPQMTRYFFLPTLICHVLRAVGAMQRQAYCKQCHCTWPLSEKKSGTGNGNL